MDDKITPPTVTEIFQTLYDTRPTLLPSHLFPQRKITTTGNCKDCRSGQVGRIRRYNSSTQCYGDWESIDENRLTKSTPSGINVVEIPLRRFGAVIKFYPKLLAGTEKEKLKKFMNDCRMYRQYRFGMFNEPRVHVMLSEMHAKVPTVGYKYHGVNMKSLPLAMFPTIHQLADK